MAKKNNKNTKIQTANIDLNKTNKHSSKYIGIIKKTVKDENNIDEMIGAVSIINTQLVTLSINNEKVRKERDFIIEAYNYAAERMLI